MNFQPDRSKIEDECVLLYSLVDLLFTKRQPLRSFAQFQYLAQKVDVRAETLLAEHLLSVAVKVRYLDDRAQILNRHDRKQVHVGDLSSGESCLQSLRWALNKLIHQASIKFSTRQHNGIVIGGSSGSAEEICIPEGLHSDEVVIVQIAGIERKVPWDIELNLTQIINEVLRVLHLDRSRT